MSIPDWVEKKLLESCYFARHEEKRVPPSWHVQGTSSSHYWPLDIWGRSGCYSTSPGCCPSRLNPTLHFLRYLESF